MDLILSTRFASMPVVVSSELLGVWGYWVALDILGVLRDCLVDGDREDVVGLGRKWCSCRGGLTLQMRSDAGDDGHNPKVK